MARKTAQTTITLYPGTKAELARRSGGPRGVSEQIRQDLDAYWCLLKIGLIKAQHHLTRAEATLLLDVLNGTLVDRLDIWVRGGLVHEVEDAIRLDGLDEKWGVDPALPRKLEAMEDSALAALIDWALQFWREDRDSTEEWTRGFQPDNAE